MNRKTTSERAHILHCLVEGNSIRATSRLLSCSKTTVIKLLKDVGEACEWYQREYLINLPCRNIQVDEIWSFVEKKNHNKDGTRNHLGDVWTFTAICADTKIVPCWLVGERSSKDAHRFILDVSERMAGRIQLTTDGYTPYVDAVENAFGPDVDYGVIKKRVDNKGRVTIKKTRVTGSPDEAKISTSYIERQNLLMRTNIKRYARRTNGFSKSVDNHNFAVAIHFMYYNFVRIHRSIRITPAMAAGITDKLWDLEDIIIMNNNYRG